MEEKTLNIQQIMEEIKVRAAEIEYQEPVSFEDIPIYKSNVILTTGPFDEEKLTKAQIEMNNCSTVLFYRDIFGNSIVRFIKKILRKLVFFLIEPMSQEISYFNAASVRAVNQLSAFAKEQAEENEKKDWQIRLLEKRLEELETQLKAQTDKAE